eukprot:1020732-Rhodomonas_salina.1
MAGGQSNVNMESVVMSLSVTNEKGGFERLLEFVHNILQGCVANDKGGFERLLEFVRNILQVCFWSLFVRSGLSWGGLGLFRAN